jgi:SAM-dependent methyltransferase
MRRGRVVFPGKCSVTDIDKSKDESERLRSGVKDAYSEAAEDPCGKHPFPLGKRFAKSLGYPRKLLRQLPTCSVDAFTGTSNVSELAELSTGDVVLDLGCGGGLDSMIAAERVGTRGWVVGVDFSRAMISRAQLAVQETERSNILFCLGEAECLPLADGSVDKALINGIFNLNPKRQAIFRELARVVRKGGAVYAAEIVQVEPAQQTSPVGVTDDDWFA